MFLLMLSIACTGEHPAKITGTGTVPTTETDLCGSEEEPALPEVCDGIDNNCDGDIDGDAVDMVTWYADGDGDGAGDAAGAVTACDAPTGAVTTADDCDDAEPAAFPGNPELCDGIDNDCDGEVDGDATDASTWYSDLDGDGYGDAASPLLACEAPANTSADGTDCDDRDADINPGATETPYDGLDNDCDATTLDDDLDEDGFSLVEDCDDLDPTAYPGATETPYDGLDNDCDATTLDDDLDEDGVSLVEDCDDLDAAVSPDAAEVCADGLDNNCDGFYDDDDVACTFDELVIAADTSDYVVAAALGTPTEAVWVRVQVAPGVTVMASTPLLPAFSTAGLPAGSVVELVVEGTIHGHGGDGACAYGGAGEHGGDAIEATVELRIDTSSGGIYGGGGGGGAGDDPSGGGGVLAADTAATAGGTRQAATAATVVPVGAGSPVEIPACTTVRPASAARQETCRNRGAAAAAARQRAGSRRTAVLAKAARAAAGVAAAAGASKTVRAAATPGPAATQGSRSGSPEAQ